MLIVTACMTLYLGQLHNAVIQRVMVGAGAKPILLCTMLWSPHKPHISHHYTAQHTLSLPRYLSSQPRRQLFSSLCRVQAWCVRGKATTGPLFVTLTLLATLTGLGCRCPQWCHTRQANQLHLGRRRHHHIVLGLLCPALTIHLTTTTTTTITIACSAATLTTPLCFIMHLRPIAPGGPGLWP